jgi:hypothetical protein
LWAFPLKFQEGAVFTKYWDEGQTRWRGGKTVVVVVGKQVGQHKHRAPKWTRRPRILNKEGGGKEKRRRGNIMIGRKTIRIIFDK